MTKNKTLPKHVEALAPGLPNGLEQLLGRFISNFAFLEEYLRGIICEIAPTSAPAGEIITSQLSFRGLVTAFGALVQEYVLIAELKTETDDVLKKIEELNEYRNNLVHSLWLRDDDDDGAVIRQKIKPTRKKGFQVQIVCIDENDLLSQCENIAHLTWRVSTIYDKHKESL